MATGGGSYEEEDIINELGESILNINIDDDDQGFLTQQTNPVGENAEVNSPTFALEDTVVFDLETTGFGSDSSIIQIAAVRLTTGEHFKRFVKPMCGYIPKRAAEITGLVYRDGVMYQDQDRNKVDSQDATNALREFIRWIKSFPGPILLVAHNAMFDSRLLVSNLNRADIDIPDDKFWFTDSLKYFKAIYPDRVKEKKSFKLEVLAKDIMNVDFKAHDALEDCQALSGLLNLNLNFQLLASQAFDVESVQNNLRELRNEKLYKSSYSYFDENKLIADAQITRLARSGLSLDDLRTVYSESGLEGLKVFLRDKGETIRLDQLASTLERHFDGQQNDQ